jgi:hypothetical protein
MPARLSWYERLARAEAFLYNARSVVLPDAGHQRGAAVRHKRSLLEHGRWEISRLAGKHPPATSTLAERERARFLLGQLNEEEPELLDALRRREAR